MLRVWGLRLPLSRRLQVEAALRRYLLLQPGETIQNLRLVREALDARKEELSWVYTVEVELTPKREAALLKRGLPRVMAVELYDYRLPSPGEEPLAAPPIVVGAGPAGLFAALTLAEAGFAPRLLERGAPVTERVAAVERFWQTGELDPENNVQFGEGGAGTFSDGKLTTQTRDPRIARVLQGLVTWGASPEILYQGAPHVGSDKLRGILLKLRQHLQQLGVEIRFRAKVEELIIQAGAIKGVRLSGGEELATEALVLAVGHSARDSYTMLHRVGVPLAAKAFSLGVRIEQLQARINRQQYGDQWPNSHLEPATYKLVYHSGEGRAVYTFCMCPGGEVVAAASEEGHLVTNGMSYAARSGVNANAGLLVSVTPQDFGSDPLQGIAWQRHWEELAFKLGGSNYRAPLQRVDDFLADTLTQEPREVQPTYRPGVELARLKETLPPFVHTALQEALPRLEASLPGFAPGEALLTGIESRSSSPLRIIRNQEGESPIRGLFPAGEGAGYAGGIISSAVDGIKLAETIIQRYRPPRQEKVLLK
ncbi:MAG: hypothetical protein FWF06_00900 [Symbiobacteriaceae bacterium]|nr:hypothetical protein [Symbiobacteriaceae bacterium]